MSGRFARIFQYGLLAATAALVVVFNYQTRLHNLDRHAEETEHLLRLKQLDVILDDEALKAVSHQLQHYDNIVATVREIEAHLSHISDEQTGLAGTIGPKTDRDIALFNSMMASKIDIIETIKSRNAIVRNTLNFLPGEVERLTGANHNPVDVRINGMMTLLLAQNINPTDRNAQHLEDILTNLEAIRDSGTGPEGLDRILRHARANLSATADVKRKMGEFLTLPTRDTLERIFDAHSAYVLGRIKNANEFRAVLMAVTLVLFLGLAVALHMMRKANRETQRTSRQFRDAVESINEGFAFFDAQGTLQFWNQTFAAMHSACGDALTQGMSYHQFYDTCASQGLYATHGPLLNAQNGMAQEIETAPDQWVLASDSRMADGGIACVRVDITETKRTQDEMRKLSRAVEQSPASVMITDTDGIITYINPKFATTTGYRADEIIGQRPSLVSSGERPAEDYAELWQTITSGREWRGEFHNKRKDGSLFWELASISPIKNDQGEITHFLAIKEDITERKQTMEQLVKAKEEAELASHAKTQFLANMSHELRTPLNAIIGFSEILKTEMFGPLGSDQYIDYTASIFDSGQHLLEVINDILDISRIETGALEIREEDVDLRPLARSCLGMVQDRAEAAKLSLHCDCTEGSVNVRGDEMRLKQILINLLSNAVKFTPEGGDVSLRIGVNDQGETEIVVHDTGYGIPADKLDKVLEPFEQVSDIYTRNHEGSGLGLYLVNSFAKLHQGRVKIASEVDQGTTVTVTLPAARTLKS